MSRIKGILIEAIRQFRHNNNDAFVTGYDVEIVQRILRELEVELENHKRAVDKMINECKMGCPPNQECKSWTSRTKEESTSNCSDCWRKWAYEEGE